MKKKEEEKHSKPLNKKNYNFFYIVLIILICIIIGIVAYYKLQPLSKNKDIISEKNKDKIFQTILKSTTIEGEKLVFKSTSGNTRIMEYTFENNVLNKVKMYEQFKDEEIFNKTKENYKKREGKDIDILNINEEEKSIEIEKKDFGSDTGKSYEETADKYLVQIIGAYEKI